MLSIGIFFLILGLLFVNSPDRPNSECEENCYTYVFLYRNVKTGKDLWMNGDRFESLNVAQNECIKAQKLISAAGDSVLTPFGYFYPCNCQSK